MLPPPDDWERKKTQSIGKPQTTAQKLIGILSICFVWALFLGLIGGCWYVGEKGKREREAKEVAEKAHMDELKKQFESYAVSHNAKPFDLLDNIPGIGELTSEIQNKLKSTPVALEMIKPDLREADGKK